MSSVKRTKNSRRSPGWKIFVVVGGVAVIPVALALAIQIGSLQPSFSNVIADASDIDSPPLLEWRTLRSAARAPHPPLMQAFGYMMDTERIRIQDGRPARAFVLMPDSGTTLHPAHEDPDEMICVILRPGTTTIFSRGQAVKVIGRLGATVIGSGCPVQLSDANATTLSRAEVKAILDKARTSHPGHGS
jgi:hypothetical protein